MLHHARILVADDDPDLLDAVVEVLERLGAEVVRAEGGDELIERIAEGRYTLIITDICMPWMSGLQAMHSARTAGLGTPVIIMTGMKDEGIPEQVLALGENAVLLRKPFEFSELEAAVAKLLSANRSGQAGSGRS